MKNIPTAPPLPDAPPTQDFSKLGFVYITVLGLADQVVPHTGTWRPLATALNYLVCIAPIVYMAFQARRASPMGVQPDSSMGRDKNRVSICISIVSIRVIQVRVVRDIVEQEEDRRSLIISRLIVSYRGRD
ncbi:hypothetical protein DSO57_1020594 [Entomophthora muscae]|uniref:Uncharacterized protein n=1 Tax=Entomophthora muscae TaxID=34485 RepID=A0ACC2UCJ4_9FUNG|nr:hypothetical protein DSO57_1020594 [Entomophthora muscae]